MSQISEYNFVSPVTCYDVAIDVSQEPAEHLRSPAARNLERVVEPIAVDTDAAPLARKLGNRPPAPAGDDTRAD